MLRVSFSDCGVMVAQAYLKQHMESLHVICVPQTRRFDEKGDGTNTYMVSLSPILKSVICPVPGCPAKAHCAEILWENFMFRHFWSEIVVVQEGSESLP